MDYFRTRLRGRAPLVLATLGTLALAACQDQSLESPTEPIAQPDAALVDNASDRVRIAFVSNRDGGESEIYSMRPNGRGQRRLTNNTDIDHSPAWSPDYTRIAFVSAPPGIAEPPHIFVMNADGTGRVQLTSGSSAEASPDWSPDGSKIAFDRDGQIIVMNADGTNQTAIPHQSNDNDWDPDWSPDGTKIVLSRDRGFSQREDIWVMNADGSGSVQLTQNDFHDTGASWSPDGTRIAFVSNRTGRYEVYVMNPDGSGQTALTSGAVAGVPAWSRNGRRLAFDGYASGNQDIHVINADGSGDTLITTHPGSDGSPAWAR